MSQSSKTKALHESNVQLPFEFLQEHAMHFPARFIISAQPRRSRPLRSRPLRNMRAAVIGFVVGTLVGIAIPARNAATAAHPVAEPARAPVAQPPRADDLKYNVGPSRHFGLQIGF